MTVLASKVRNKVRALIQTYGSAGSKQKLWDEDFANGRWDCLDTTINDCVYSRIERVSRGGSILDLGCGSGSTANELDGSSYSDYTGVDISEVALDKARKRSEQNGRGEKCRFVQGDVVTYTPDKHFDLILFRDSIYYIKRQRIKATLLRYAHWLKDSGVFIVRIWNGRGKLSQFVEILEGDFEIVEQYCHEDSDTVVLVFKCRTETKAS